MSLTNEPLKSTPLAYEHDFHITGLGLLGNQNDYQNFWKFLFFILLRLNIFFRLLHRKLSQISGYLTKLKIVNFFHKFHPCAWRISRFSKIKRNLPHWHVFISVFNTCDKIQILMFSAPCDRHNNNLKKKKQKQHLQFYLLVIWTCV